MTQRMTRRRGRFAAVALTSLLTLLLAACSTTPPQGGLGADRGSADDGPYKIVMSLNQIAISQRAQGVNGVEHLAATKFKDKVDLEVKVSGDTVSDQIASLQQIIRQEPDALLVVASSFSALNQVLTQACNAGITVVNFAQVAEGVDCTYKRDYPSDLSGADAARFMCKQLNGSGQVLADKGIAGLPSAEAEHKALTDTLAAECPGITVAATYQSMYSPGPELTAISAALAVNKDVDGIVSLAYCSAGAKAMNRAKLGPVPMACGGVNENALVCEDEKIPCFLRNNPSVAYSLALETAIGILDGQDVAQVEPAYTGNFVMNASADFEHEAPLTEPVIGKDYFADAAPELILPVTVGDFGITPEIAMGND
jgi:ribose transport system substrate-binding protein